MAKPLEPRSGIGCVAISAMNCSPDLRSITTSMRRPSIEPDFASAGIA